MKNPISRFVKNERGVTALETAIILIAFVVVAAIFAFTILSTGTFLTERSKDAAYAGLSQVRGSLEVKGSVVAKDTSAPPDGKLDHVIFNLANVAGGTPIDFNTTTPVVAMKYRSTSEEVAVSSCWTKTSIGQDNGDDILEPGEVFQIDVDLSSNTCALNAQPEANDTFSIEVIPPTGSTLVLQRTVPPKVDLVTDLH